MSSARWSRVQDVFNAAIESEMEQRADLLARECADDVSLRREVELLLQGHESSGLVDCLAQDLEVPGQWRAHVDAMEWTGRRVAQYLVLSPVGAGSMGWVFKARDERLGRTVALKFLPPHLSARVEAKGRFLLEARAAAALDHPNICTIHEIGETADGQMFIAMPLYEGETLEARLERGPLAVAELIRIAAQIANGLARAHDHGIVHRDIKPSNVILLPDGSVKVLDFGIAAMESADRAHTGVVMGTLAYMSPEQIRGEAVDLQTDIWSLGVVLYEIATGGRPFHGESSQEIRSSILTTDPQPAGARRAELPGELDEIIGKALARTSGQRYASMTSMATDLVALAEQERYAMLATTRSGDRSAAVSSAGERRRAVVLVTVVSDYAALVERHAPEALESLMDEIRAAAVEVVRRHGGLVNHAHDEEIVSLFGVRSGHEDDDLRAVRSALELNARLFEIAPSAPGERASRAHLQSGLHSDSLVVHRLNTGPRRYAVTGTAMQVAQRLAMLASRNTVLISPECRRLVTPFVEARPLDPVTLLTGDAPVTPYIVLGESGLQTRLEAAMRHGLTTYAGRHAELETLLRRFAEARAGRGQAALIVGEAGVGKSRLLYELQERISASEVRVLQARCHSYGGIAPYVPFVEILRQSLRMTPAQIRPGAEAEVVARILALNSSLERFIPLYLHLLSIASEQHPLPRELRGEHLQQAMPEALVALVTALAEQSATVLLLEDWHWSDEGSREALHRLVDAVPARALFVVVTSRSERVERMAWARTTTQLQLAPLDFDASVAIMQDVLHVERVASELAQRLYERTGGNPFFLEEICRTLLEQGSVATHDGEGVAAGGVETLLLPDTVQAVIRTRLDALQKDSLEVLRIASVIGREFAHPLLADIADHALNVPQALEQLSAAGLIQQISVVPEVAYRFKHALTHEVTYESFLGHQRRSWHSVIGRAIERLDPQQGDEQAELLAYHFARAEAWRPAVHYGRRAADRARALGQFADGLAMLDRVQDCLTHLPADEERADLTADIMLQQERLCETLGQRGRQQQIVGELITLLAPRGASARLAQAYLRQGDLLTLLKHFDAADRALGTALRVSREHGDAGLERHALRSIGLLRWHDGRHAEALAITERALTIDRERRDELAVAGDLANLGIILKSMGEHTRAIASLEEALAMPALVQDPSLLVYSLQSLANVYRVLGQQDRALEHLQRADEISRDHLLPIQRSFHLLALAHIHLQQGRIDESLQTYHDAVELSRRARHADGLVQSLRTLGEVLLGLGRDDEALPHLTEAAALFAQLEDRAGEIEVWNHVATTYERKALAHEAATAWQRMRDLCVAVGNAPVGADSARGHCTHVPSTLGLF